MKKIITNCFLLLSLLSLGQKTTIANGTYIAKDKEQNIRLILKDNQYDLSFTAGTFETKKDSLIFKDFQRNKQTFNVTFNNNESNKQEKIKIKLKIDGYDFYNIYIASFNENTVPQYRRISDIQNENALIQEEEKIQNLAEFEIVRSDFLVLVKEDYLYQSEICKFKIPENVSDILVDIKDKTDDNLKLAGTYNKDTNELTITNNGKNALIFVSEDKVKTKFPQIAIPIEIKNIEKWTYLGKETTDFKNVDAATEGVNDSESSETKEPIKYTLNVENNLASALINTAKKPHKLLIVYYDPKNKSAKSSFDAIVAEQIKQLNYNMYSDYDLKYDLFDFYLANKKDEKWLKGKNITTFPTVIAINSSGDLLSQSKSTLFDLQNQFYYYDDFGKNLTRTNALVNFKKAITKSLNDTENIKAFANLVALEIPYEYNEVLPVDAVKINQVEFVPPVISDIEAPKDTEKIREVPADEQKGEPNTEQIIKTEEYLPPIVEDIKPDYNVFNKPVFDKKQMQLVWNNMIQNHKNDSKPNIDLAIIIIKELKNIGFSKQIFNEEKIIDETNFQAFEYIFKHINKIEQARLDSIYNADAIHNFDPIENEIKYILNGQIKLVNPYTPIAFQQKIIDSYKQLIDYQKSGTFEKIDFNFQNDYFELLKTTAINSKSDKQFVSEYDDYHNNLFNNKTPIIETLDNLFKTEKGVEYESETWTQFKINYSNSANNAAWYVVEHSKNSESIKKAIKWSEHSLKISKNNHYYLDTLAQLYYKNGEKEKAFATEQLAIDNNFDDANEYITTLQKMKNGSY